MARPIQDLMRETRSLVQRFPNQFVGVGPGNVIPHLGTVAPDLWRQWDEFYREQGGGQGLGNAIAQGALAGTIMFPGVGTKIGALAGGLKNFTAAGAPTLNEWALANPQLGAAFQAVGPDSAQPPAPEPIKQPEPPAKTPEQLADERMAGLSAKLDELYNKAGQSVRGVLDDEYARTRSKTASEEAALGRLNSPIFRHTTEALDRNKNLALSQAMGNLAGQQASGTLNLSGTIEDILNQNRRYGQDLDFRRESLNKELGNAAAERESRAGLSRYLSDSRLRAERDQFDDTKNDPLRWLNGLTSSAGNLFSFKKVI